MNNYCKSIFAMMLAGMFPLSVMGAEETSVFVPVESITTPDVTKTKEPDGILNKALNKLDARLSEHVNISGFILGRGQYSTDPSNFGGFDIRMLRFILGGDITKDFTYRVQMEFAGSPRILDAWLEWKKYDFFRIRAGQQKRNFTFENPWSPVTLGVPDYSQVIMQLSGFTDRVGEHTCGGRDVGIVFTGDFVKLPSHHLFRYDLGVFNGNGINKADNNKFKDVIGSMFIRPVKDLHIGGGYWLGKYGPQKEMVDRKRWTVGFKYDDNRYLLRGEYISSKGGKLKEPDANLNSDGWYLTAGMSVSKALRAFVKYDVYRDDKTYDSQSTKYVGAINWTIHKYIILQASYFYQDNKMPGSKNSNNIVAQMFVRY
ncbi:MAG: porin [Bacteroidales bacterium]